ncbi:MAG TPA: AAA family ATPase [Myxococcota bacterium]|nr:AAA family ATPase [Myxococcota bacterium]HQK51566.1 AAA family ATPase [Myxococcota bacterium]
MNVQTVVLVGPHGSGKTTLGQELSRVLGWPFDDEIGKRMRREALVQDPTAHAARPQPDFDRRVMEAEVARDRVRRKGGPRVVETWHPGNLAYCEARDPRLAEAWRPRLRTLSRRAPGLLVIPLHIDLETVQRRLQEAGPPDMMVPWLWQVAMRAEAIARQWGLMVSDPVSTMDRPVAASLADVLERIDAFQACPRPEDNRTWRTTPCL